MRRILLFAAVAAMLCSCNKEQNPAFPDAGKEVVFNIGGEGIDLGVTTKTVTPVTSVTSVYWECQNGTTVTYPVSSYTVSSNKVNTGKYWPAAGATYTYLVANKTFTTKTGLITATNTTDIVAGKKTEVTGNTCTVTLDHIFARTGTLTMNTQSGYTISGVSWTIESSGSGTGTAGKYTIGTGWGSTATTSLSEQAITSSSDLYLIPGDYTVSVTYTLTKGAWSGTFTKSDVVTLVQGKINSITGTATGGAASEITFSVSVTAWGSNPITANFS